MHCHLPSPEPFLSSLGARYSLRWQGYRWVTETVKELSYTVEDSTVYVFGRIEPVRLCKEDLVTISAWYLLSIMVIGIICQSHSMLDKEGSLSPLCLRKHAEKAEGLPMPQVSC